jgi:hypothetical protein
MTDSAYLILYSEMLLGLFILMGIVTVKGCKRQYARIKSRQNLKLVASNDRPDSTSQTHRSLKVLPNSSNLSS